MTKKDFIALADAIREHNQKAIAARQLGFLPDSIDTLADFCATQNPNFKRGLWLDYVAGKCGPGGGKVK